MLIFLTKRMMNSEIYQTILCKGRLFSFRNYTIYIAKHWKHLPRCILASIFSLTNFVSEDSFNSLFDCLTLFNEEEGFELRHLKSYDEILICFHSCLNFILVLEFSYWLNHFPSTVCNEGLSGRKKYKLTLVIQTIDNKQKIN